MAAVSGEPPAPAPMGVKVPDKQAMETFLRTGIAMMQSEGTRELLKSKSVTTPGLKLIELQRAGWDPLGIDQDIGCSYLENIEKICPGDKDMVQLRTEFVRQAQRSFVQSLEDRKPTKLESKKKMSRETIVMFFDACNTKMDLPETSLRLKKHLEKTGKMPNTVIIEMQREMLEVLGVEKDHGCAMLSNIQKDFPNDKELFARFEGWRQKATSTCMQVIKQHQAQGGGMPMGPFGDNPQMEKLQAKAKEEIEAMDPKQRGELVEKMKKRVEVFMNLPPEGRQSYMSKLSDEDKLEFVKTQILLVSMMRQQWQAQQGGGNMAAPKQQDEMAMAGGAPPAKSEEQRRLEEQVDREVEAEIAKSSGAATSKDLAPPSQQMMM